MFAADGDEHRAVTTIVSRTGAFAKASRVPQVGATITLREVYGHSEAQVFLRGRIVHAEREATLEQPETGFGIRFIELFTQGDPAALEDFLRYLDPAMTDNLEIGFEERSAGVFAVYRFGEATAPSGAAPTPSGGAGIHEAPPPSIDLNRELDRLERQDGRRERAAAPPPVPVQAARRARSKRRSVTGIFTALFRRRSADPAFDDDSPTADDATPALDAEQAAAIEEADQPHAVVTWDDKRALMRVDAVSAAEATLRGTDAAPAVGESVALAPVGVPSSLTQLRLAGHVTKVDREEPGGMWVIHIALADVDGADARKQLKRYVRHVAGR